MSCGEDTLKHPDDKIGIFAGVSEKTTRYGALKSDRNSCSSTSTNDSSETRSPLERRKIVALPESHAKQAQEDYILYYGVCLEGAESILKDEDEALVFCDKKEALQTVKKHSGARFKVFSTREDAANFSKSSCSTPKSADLSFQDSPTMFRPAVGEKPSAFKAPRSQDMVKLRKAIESGDAEYFTKVVWENPRYLVSCGDTPTILQEGFRYNALHVAAKHNQVTICSLVLGTLDDPKFLPVMYSDDTPQVTQQRREFIVDLYLNMPEKGLCETPLHFACKFGCAKVAEILLQHPACNTRCQNKYGQIPQEIICDRNGNAEVKKQIAGLFEALYYVPVLRSEDNSVQGIVGTPYSMVQPSNVGPCSPISPSLLVRAKAGPMSSSQADAFYRKWRSSAHAFSLSSRRQSERDIRLSDSRKGLERIGRALAKEMNVPWSEYWSFLDSWVDISSAEGLQKLETHLRGLYHKAMSQNSFHESTSSGDHPCKNLESPEVLSPISLLCRRLEGFHLNSSPLNTSPDTPALFGRHSCSGSPLDSSSHSENAMCSPVLRDRPDFLSKQHRNLNLSNSCVVSTPVSSSAPVCNLPSGNFADDTKPQSKVRSIYFEKTCTSLVSFITDTLNVFDSEHLALVSDSVLPTFKKILTVAHRFNQEDLSAFHADVAREVVQRLEDDLVQQHELILAIKKCYISLQQENNDDSSSGEEQPSRNNRLQQVRFRKHLLSRKHLKCVLNVIKNLMENRISCESKCHCTWEPFVSQWKRNKTTNVSHLSTGEESSDEEFHTPPSSFVGSPLSSVGDDIFTPDEGIRVFFQGLCLSKADLDVQNALENVAVDSVLYPHIHMWKQAMESCTTEEIKSLSTPVYGSGLKNCSPKSEPSRGPQVISSTPLTSRAKCEGWKTAPHRMTSVQERPKNFYDCLLSWEETGD